MLKLNTKYIRNFDYVPIFDIDLVAIYLFTVDSAISIQSSNFDDMSIT